MSDIDDWIEKQIESGYTIEEIKEALDEGGWDSGLVDKFMDNNSPRVSKISRKKVYLVVLVFAITVSVYFLSSIVLIGNGDMFDDSEIEVRRTLDPDTVRPSQGSTVRLFIENDYDQLELSETVPNGFGISDEGDGLYTGDTVKWNLDSSDMVEYRVVAPGASSGVFTFNGTYKHGDKTGKIEGENTIEVRW